MPTRLYQRGRSYQCRRCLAGTLWLWRPQLRCSEQAYRHRATDAQSAFAKAATWGRCAGVQIDVQ